MRSIYTALFGVICASGLSWAGAGSVSAQADDFWSGASDEQVQIAGMSGDDLVRAASSANGVEVKTLTRLGAPLDHRDEAGRTALWYATRSGQADVMATLLSAGADPDLADRDGVSPLHIAAAGSALAPAQLLLGHGADINAVDLEGRTPLTVALASNAGPAWIEWLLVQGSNPFIPAADGRRPAELIEARAAQSGQAVASDTGDGDNGRRALLREALTLGVTAYSGVEAGVVTDIVADVALGDREGNSQAQQRPQMDAGWAQVLQIVRRANDVCRASGYWARNCSGAPAANANDLAALQMPVADEADWGFAAAAIATDEGQ